MPRFGRPIRRVVRPLAAARRRPFGAPRLLAPGPVKALALANRLFAEGQFAPAAERFEMLANAARANNLPFAPRLFFQAARANWRAGQVPHGMQLLHTGLGMLVTAGAADRVHQISTAAISELEQMGCAREAEEVKKFLSQVPAAESDAVTDIDTEAAPETPAKEAHPNLPATCGQCGAIVRPDEVEWIDTQTAECAFCGSPIRPEKD